MTKINQIAAVDDPIKQMPIPPADLPPEALEFWSDTVDLLCNTGIVHMADRSALIALSVQWARAERARKVLFEEGYFALGSMGQIVEHPALAIERSAHAMFLRFAEQYGLTPIAREKIQSSLEKRQTMGRPIGSASAKDRQPPLVTIAKRAG
jgi:P27 family predicted phage terminase small subunit